MLAARPKTLPAAIVPVWAGCVLAWKLTGTFDLPLALWTLLVPSPSRSPRIFSTTPSIEKGADTDRRLGPVRVTASGMLGRTVMAIAAVFLLLALVCGVFLYQARGWPIV